MKKKVVIIGAGPAGLAAGLELAKNGVQTIILEKDKQVGGISKTINFKNSLFDIGPHRFFTKNEEVKKLWENTLSPEEFRTVKRLTRIYYKNKFFFYPLQPFNALFGLGLTESFFVILSYLKSKLFHYKDESTFDRWVSNRFGKKLYQIFFKNYTEKVWGVPCEKISAKWASQRIRGLSLFSVIKNAFFPDKSGKIKTLVPEFKYPKYGAGMMYERMADNLKKYGGQIFLNEAVNKIFYYQNKIIKVYTQNGKEYCGDYFISTIPITLLIKKLSPLPSEEIIEYAKKLKFRSFLTVNLILKVENNPFPDNWLYIHSPEVKLARLVNFKNWSPEMLLEKDKITLSLEYFCQEKDDFWEKNDHELIKFGLEELKRINLIKKFQFEDGFVLRIPNAYPFYFQNYENYLERIKEYLNRFENLQTIGRAGMFRYNNMDHSILSGIYAARNILGKKYNVWDINIEEEYYEEIRK